MNSDFKELLQSLADQGVDYLVVGGYAVIFHAQPRFTKDLDVWVKPDPRNARNLMKAFLQFGLPLIDIEESDFAKPKTQYMIGVPPTAIDFLTSIPGLVFEKCWENRVEDDIDGVPVNYLGKPDLITSKESAGRDKDREDLRNLRGIP